MTPEEAVELWRMVCEEKIRLVEECHRAIIVYSSLARVLNASRTCHHDHDEGPDGIRRAA